MDQSDGQLLALYRRGDAEALDVLVRRYKKQLFAFIINMMAGGNDADEIFQEVWFKAIRKISQYREKNFLAWLIRIARNTIIDRWRAGRKFVTQSEKADDGLTLAERVADGSPGPEQRVSARDLGRRIAGAIMLLPIEQREVVTMRVYSELQFKEIARIQGVSINTALARMQYGLAKLRESLQDEYTTLEVR
jgi:RNA polymerase sigma-70 factor (ECF subfamily)